MRAIKAVGREAASKKYDILSAMMAYGLASDKQTRLLTLRLMALITTRYNWQSDQLTMGQAEIARLWCVEPRTVKREFAKLKKRDWITVKRQGARGRVGTYGIRFDMILKDSQPHWENIGADYAERAGGLLPPPAAAKVVKVDFGGPTVSADGNVDWQTVQVKLHKADADTFAAWFERLVFIGVEKGELTLLAPSRFVARYIDQHLMRGLMEAVQGQWGDVTGVRFEVRG